MVEVWGILLLALVLVLWILRKGALLWVAGVDARHVQTAADRARYTSMGAIVVLTATAAAASLTVALTLVFSGHSWLRFLPAGLVWGAIVFSFDRWIVSSFDYGPLTEAEETKAEHHSRSVSKIVQFLVRLTMAVLVGLVISEPIVLAIFGPEISQQLTVQHTMDASKQAAQIDAAQQQQLVVLNRPVKAAGAALAAATAAADNAHKVYLCELTGKCDLPPGEVTGVPGQGPQAAQDFAAWQRALAQQQQDQQIADRASATERIAAAALAQQTSAQIRAATAAVNADNGLLAREKALDTLSQQNPGFLLRRIMLWLALMFIDLAPVLLKTFSPKTLRELLARTEANQIAVRARADAIRGGQNAMNEAVADAEHESAKNAITREFDLEYHRAVTELEYSLRLEEARARLAAPAGPPRAGRAETGAGRTPSARARPGRTMNRTAKDGGWVIGRRWQVQRTLPDAQNSQRVPFVATDLNGEYPFEVVVKIIAPPPRVAGTQAMRRTASRPGWKCHCRRATSTTTSPRSWTAISTPQHGFYIVTRLYPETLEQYLQDAEARQSLTIGRVLDLAAQILAGLQAAWDQGFVHLDLKPANIAIAADGTVKLIDFGLAQQYQKANGGNDTTMTAARFTLFYAPPEQMERQDASWISRNADLRALGAVIYRMLTGYPPLFREALAIGLVDAAGRFDASAYLDVKKLVASTEPVPVAELIPGVPPELDLLLRTWLRADPRMRCPGNPGPWPTGRGPNWGPSLSRCSADGKSHDLVGPWIAREPEFADLRAQVPSHPAVRSKIWAGDRPPAEDARSGETLEVAYSPAHRGDPGTVRLGTSGAATPHGWSINEDDMP